MEYCFQLAALWNFLSIRWNLTYNLSRICTHIIIMITGNLDWHDRECARFAGSISKGVLKYLCHLVVVLSCINSYVELKVKILIILLFLITVFFTTKLCLSSITSSHFISTIRIRFFIDWAKPNLISCNLNSPLLPLTLYFIICDLS